MLLVVRRQVGVGGAAVSSSSAGIDTRFCNLVPKMDPSIRPCSGHTRLLTLFHERTHSFREHMPRSFIKPKPLSLSDIGRQINNSPCNQMSIAYHVMRDVRGLFTGSYRIVDLK